MCLVVLDDPQYCHSTDTQNHLPGSKPSHREASTDSFILERQSLLSKPLSHQTGYLSLFSFVPKEHNRSGDRLSVLGMTSLAHSQIQAMGSHSGQRVNLTNPHIHSARPCWWGRRSKGRFPLAVRTLSPNLLTLLFTHISPTPGDFSFHHFISKLLGLAVPIRYIFMTELAYHLYVKYNYVIVLYNLYADRWRHTGLSLLQIFFHPGMKTRSRISSSHNLFLVELLT